MVETVQAFIRFLVPVDYSIVSKQASLYALNLASQLNAEVHFLHVYYSPAIDALEITGSSFTQPQVQTEVIEEMGKTEEKLMEDFVREVLQEAGPINIPVKKIVLPGIPEDEITDYAQENEYDLVVMGTRGKNAQKVAIFGSVTISVMDHILIPLLVVPENFLPMQREIPNNLLFVTTFEKHDPHTLERLMRFLTPVTNLKIFLGHIETEESDDWDDIRLKGLADLIHTKFHRPDVEVCRFKEKDLLKELDDYISRNNINAIAMASQRRSLIAKLFTSDLTRKILYHSTVPLLIFHS